VKALAFCPSSRTVFRSPRDRACFSALGLRVDSGVSTPMSLTLYPLHMKVSPSMTFWTVQI